MKKLLGYLPFHFLLFLIVGICYQFYTDGWSYGIVNALYALLFLFSLGYFTRKSSFFTFITWITFFILGICIVLNNDASIKEDYFKNYIEENQTSIVNIRKVLKPGNYNHKYIAEVVQLNHHKTVGSILLNIQKDSFVKRLKVDDRLLLKEPFVAVKGALNPHQFDYQNYLAKQGIYDQLFLNNEDFLLLKTNATSLLGKVDQIRIQIQQSLKKYNFSEDELSVMNALLLGQRQDISKELIDDYSKAGAIHILAVSGLHVGILLLILSTLLKPLERIKYGTILKLVIMILFMWFFALIAGLSASVVRAVTMFSAVAIGQFLNKKNAIEHSLIFSMFLLLLCKPMFLFEVGFQLSYLAVFGIIWIQPKIYSLWNPKFIVFDKAWQLITVSIAAQFGILPLSLFYFHQFPGLFLVSNLIIIPFLGLILMGGILIIFLASFSIMPDFLADIYGWVISLLNSFVRFISRQEEFLLSGISYSGLKMIVSYGLIIIGFQFLIKRNSKRLLLFLFAILLFQSLIFYEKYETETQQEFIIFQKSRQSIFGHRIGEELKIYHDLDSLSIKNQYLLENYKVGESIDYSIQNISPNLFYFKGQPILMIDSLGVYDLPELQNPIIILQQSPKVNLEKVIEKLQPVQIIADGSNYKSYVKLWESTSIKTKTPFWSTYQNGAFIIK